MKLRLDVVRLMNKDVIATSCEPVWGVARINCVDIDEDLYQIRGFQNGTDNINVVNAGRKVDIGPFKNAPDGYTTIGWYHIDASGNIIERCPYDDEEEVYNHHHIDVNK